VPCEIKSVLNGVEGKLGDYPKLKGQFCQLNSESMTAIVVVTSQMQSEVAQVTQVALQASGCACKPVAINMHPDLHSAHHCIEALLMHSIAAICNHGSS
jgi:hypothetical protein